MKVSATPRGHRLHRRLDVLLRDGYYCKIRFEFCSSNQPRDHDSAVVVTFFCEAEWVAANVIAAANSLSELIYRENTDTTSFLLQKVV